MNPQCNCWAESQIARIQGNYRLSCVHSETPKRASGVWKYFIYASHATLKEHQNTLMTVLEELGHTGGVGTVALYHVTIALRIGAMQDESMSWPLPTWLLMTNAAWKNTGPAPMLLK